MAAAYADELWINIYRVKWKQYLWPGKKKTLIYDIKGENILCLWRASF